MSTPTRPGSPPARRIAARLIDAVTAHPAIAACLFAVLLWTANPAGYIGGGGDEYHYLIAARCTAEHGFCLPGDHWWRRWPIVLPTALALSVFGEGYAALSLVPLLYALGCVALLADLVARRFGGAAGLLAGIIFAATQLIAEIALEPGIDMPELLFVLASVALLDRARVEPGFGAVAVAGLAAGLAVQARPTGLVVLALAIAWLLATHRRGWLLPFVAAAIVPSLVEALVYAAAAGDPLLGWKLSLAHVRVPSTELMPWVDTSHSPLFNPDYIAGWRRPMGIHVHWLVDGLLNYLFHPAVAITLAAAGMLLALEWRSVRAGWRRGDSAGRALPLAFAFGTLWFGALTYGFAIDPKPRMFLPTLAAAAATLGVLAVRRWRESRVLVAGALALILAKAVVVAYERFDLRRHAAAAPALVAAAGPGLSVDPRTARFLALVPAVRALPLFADDPAQRRLLLIGGGDCVAAARAQGYAGWTPVRTFAAPVDEPAAVVALRSRGLFFGPAVAPVLCVLAR